MIIIISLIRLLLFKKYIKELYPFVITIKIFENVGDIENQIQII